MPEISAKVRQIDALKLFSQTDTPVMLVRHDPESTGLHSRSRRKYGAFLVTSFATIEGCALVWQVSELMQLGKSYRDVLPE